LARLQVGSERTCDRDRTVGWSGLLFANELAEGLAGKLRRSSAVAQGSSFPTQVLG